MKKWLLIGEGLVVVIVGVLFYLYSSLGSLIKAEGEKYGSEITQAKVGLTLNLLPRPHHSWMKRFATRCKLGVSLRENVIGEKRGSALAG